VILNDRRYATRYPLPPFIEKVAGEDR